MEFDIEWHDRLGSTNACMRERFYTSGAMVPGLVIAAREQTNGRGRQDRKWLSSPNSSLCFSIFLENNSELIRIPSLTMAAALGVTELLNSKSIRAAPKWPNDVLMDEKKICGILSERVEHDSNHGIIVGIGLNVNMSSEEAAAIDRPATSMMIESGRAFDSGRILEELLPHLNYWIDEWMTGGFAAIRQAWTEKAGPIGKRLSVHDGDICKSGKLAGFGEHGELLLETDNGLETIWSGDVT
jgi:BirA family biotin operon repressor/biotin-[acetyl-CoA-carboxylase] ligase